MWNLVAGAAVTVHYIFVAYLFVGGFVAWRWRWLIVPHVLAAVWAVLIVTTNVPCPLTALQNTAREHLGLPALRGGFIELYVRGTFYPTGYDTIAQLVLGTIVVGSWAGFVLRHRQRGAAVDRVSRDGDVSEVTSQGASR